MHYNYFRDYDPRTGRYVEPDPVGLYGGLNSYAFVKNNPITRIDPLGLKSEKRLMTLDEAAIAAIDYIIIKSTEEDLEYGGFLYYDKDYCCYHYTKAVPGDKFGIHVEKFNKPPRGIPSKAIYHTHPGTGYNVSWVSTLDQFTSSLMHIPIYLGTSYGLIKVWNDKTYDRIVR